MKVLTAILALTLATSTNAKAASADVRHAALHAYSMCWIATYTKLREQVGLDPAIDAANAACKQQLLAYRSVTDGIEAGRAMISIMQAAKAGGFDNVKNDQ
ncbi:MAG: hypothetical protein WAU78_02735 [Roseiarcus sp.]